MSETIGYCLWQIGIAAMVSMQFQRLPAGARVEAVWDVDGWPMIRWSVV